MSLLRKGAYDTVIISEPPSTLSSASVVALVRAVFGDDLSELHTFRWPVGVDGWLADLVLKVRVHSSATVPVLSGETMTRWNAPTEEVNRLTFLQQYFYQTADGFWLDDMSHPRSAPFAKLPDLTVSAADLKSWTADSSTVTWQSMESGSQPFTWAQLKSRPGTYRLGNDLVVLVIPAQFGANAQADFRRFAVYTDMLVGAVKESGNVMILGRPRFAALAQLPPLRFETLTAFAAHHATELSQSYERNSVFAGKVTSGPRLFLDWAPILLSGQLDDTEAGIVLNLSDQILKSWSEHGDIQYAGFHHRQPASYPFGSMGAFEYFNNKYDSPSLIYNWNTQKFSTLASSDDVSLLAPNRTGALPIVYDPTADTGASGKAAPASSVASKDARDKAVMARDYFAKLGEPLLVRDVQNVLLYQLAQHFLRAPDLPIRSSRTAQVLEILDHETFGLLSQAVSGQGFSDDPTLADDIRHFLNTHDLSLTELAHIIADPRTAETAARAKFDAANQAFQNACASMNGTMLTNSCQYPPDADAADLARLDKANADIKTADAMGQSIEGAQDITKRLSAVTDNGPILATILSDQKVRMASDNGFIHTPAVVLSIDVSDPTGVGGHNIYAAAEEVSVDALGAVTTPVSEVLQTKSSGSLLDEMQLAAKTVDAQALDRAAQCNCDAYVTESEDGSLTIVKTIPPPAHAESVAELPGLIEALRPPPILTKLEFNNISQSRVDDVLASVELSTDHPTADSLLGRIKDTFSPHVNEDKLKRREGQTLDSRDIELTINRGDHPDDAIIVNVGKPAPKTFVYSGERPLLQNVADFGATLGYRQVNSTRPSIQLILRFNNTADSGANALGIRTVVRNVTVSRRPLLSAVGDWLRGLSQGQPLNIADETAQLDKLIRSRVPTEQRKYIYAKNVGAFRVAILTRRSQLALVK